MMESKEYRTVDKSEWPMRGAWDGEPDKAQWKDEATGLPCLIHRGPAGALCGYVGVAEGHRLYGEGYDAADVSVHGGLTFANECQPAKDESRGICHVPGPGEPDHVWWFGFDCAHAGDVSPAYDRGARPCPWESDGYNQYRDFKYVKAEVTSLAAQLYNYTGEIRQRDDA